MEPGVWFLVMPYMNVSVLQQLLYSQEIMQ